MVHVMEKSSGRTFLSNVRNMATQRSFYEDGVSEGGVEHALAELEAHAAPVLEKLISTSGEERLTHGEMRTLATFIAVLDSRTAAVRSALRDAADSLDDFLREVSHRLGAGFHPNAPQSEGKARDEHNDFMWGVAAESRERLGNMRWCLLRVAGDTMFVTSDHPVVKRNSHLAPAPWMGNLGWASPGLEVFLPLVPQLCLCISDHDEIPQGLVADYPDTGVREHNLLQARWAERFLFSHAEPELSRLNQEMEATPELRQPGYRFELLHPELLPEDGD